MFTDMISKLDRKKIVYLRLTQKKTIRVKKKTFQSNGYMQTGKRFI